MKKQSTFNLSQDRPIVHHVGKMLLHFIATMLFLFYWTLNAFSQTGSISGKIMDENGEGFPSASVIVLDSIGSATAVGAKSDYDGNYEIKNLKVGHYNLKFQYIGYKTRIEKGVVVRADNTTLLSIKLEPSDNAMSEVMVIAYKMPLIQKSSTTYSSKLSQSDIKNLPTQSISDLASQSAGVYQQDANKGLSIRGGRGDATVYYVNGRKVIGKPNVPIQGVDQLSIITGGVPAKYGSAEDMQLDQAKMPIDNTRVEPTKPETGTEEFNTIIENEFLVAARSPLSTFSIDVDAASYSILRRKLMERNAIPADAIRLEEMINYFPYNYPDASAEQPFSVQTEMSDCPWDSSHVLLKIGIQGKKIDTEKQPPSNLVFLIDVSGSMQSMDKLPLVQKSLKLLVNQLKPDDQVALVVYAGSAGLVLPSTPAVNKQKIIDAIEQLEAGGSTAGGAGIHLAYKTALESFKKEGNNRVILCTDGDFNVGVSSENELVNLIEEKRKSGVFLSVLGFGTGNYKDSRMEQLADKGNGNYAYIDNEKEAQKNMVAQMGANFITIAKDVKIQAVFNPTAVKSYRLIGYENRKLQDEDFSNDKIDAGEIGAGANVTALYELVLSKERKMATIDLADKKHKNDQMELSSNDLMGLRIRFKKPDENKSALIEERVGFDIKKLSETSNDFRFAAAVASFGMLLRHSKFSGNFTLEKTATLAKGALGEDPDGLREEMLSLVDLAEKK